MSGWGPRPKDGASAPEDTLNSQGATETRRDQATQEETGEETPAAVGVVVRTGASTSRGRQMQRVLFPSLVGLKYDVHLPAVFALLLAYALLVVFIICENSPNATGVAGTTLSPSLLLSPVSSFNVFYAIPLSLYAEPTPQVSPQLSPLDGGLTG